MTSTISVNEKTVNNRTVISFSKTYADQEHEVFAPREQGHQILLDLLAVLNEDNERGDELVLVRKRDLGRLENAGQPAKKPHSKTEHRKDAIGEIASVLFDDDTSREILDAIERQSDSVEADGGVSR